MPDDLTDIFLKKFIHLIYKTKGVPQIPANYYSIPIDYQYDK